MTPFYSTTATTTETWCAADKATGADVVIYDYPPIRTPDPPPKPCKRVTVPTVRRTPPFKPAGRDVSYHSKFKLMI